MIITVAIIGGLLLAFVVWTIVDVCRFTRQRRDYLRRTYDDLHDEACSARERS